MKWDDSDMENAFDEGVKQEKERDCGDWNDFDSWLEEYRKQHIEDPDYRKLYLRGKDLEKILKKCLKELVDIGREREFDPIGHSMVVEKAKKLLNQ